MGSSKLHPSHPCSHRFCLGSLLGLRCPFLCRMQLCHFLLQLVLMRNREDRWYWSADMAAPARYAVKQCAVSAGSSTSWTVSKAARGPRDGMSQWSPATSVA